MAANAGSLGADDTNSIVSVTQPWLRSIDGLNTHDDAVRIYLVSGLYDSLFRSIDSLSLEE